MNLHRAATPTTLEAEERALRVLWSTGVETELPYLLLRRACPCASCVEELTGRPLLDPAGVPDDIFPTDIRPVGLYAVQFAWSDGHTTGIYTYDLLRNLAARLAS